MARVWHPDRFPNDIRLAAAASLVPVLRNTTRRTPLIAGGVNRTCQSFRPGVVAVKVEMDGDLHVALQDATGDKAGIVVCEIPAKQQWSSIREKFHPYLIRSNPRGHA